MTREPEDRILDACLEEMLGGARAPDLTERILARMGGSAPAPQPAADAFEPQPPPVARRPQEIAASPRSEPNDLERLGGGRPGARARRPRRRTFGARGAALAVAAAAALMAVVVLWQQHAGQGGEGARDTAAGPAPRRPDAGPQGSPPGDIAANQRPPRQPERRDEPGPQRQPPGKNDIELAPFDEPLFPTEELFSAAPPAVEPAPSPPSARDQLSDEQIVQRTNALLAESWREAGVTAAPASDEQWCRRLFLRMLGRIPTVDELESLAADSSPGRRERLIRRLQESEQYADEFAAHWASFWATVMIGRRGGVDEDSPASREHLEQYLRRVIRDDVPYDEMAAELIAASGSGRPGAEDFNPAANFLLATMDDKGLLATDRTFRVFHGRQLRCIQCHTHPSIDSWTQRQFWSLNAFFRQTRVEPGPQGPRLVDRDFRGEGPGGVDEAEVFFEQLNGETVAALPAYPGAGPLPASGRVSDVRRRRLLSQLVVEDDRLAAAAVNRLWSHFHGFGFTRPIDDMGPHNPPSHPELLSHLSDQFAAGGYRLNRLVRWIASADSFSRTSQITQSASIDSPEAGGRPLFSRYYTRQLQPEAVYDSLRMIADAEPGRPELAGRARWLGQFVRPMGTDEGEEQNNFQGDVRQSLIIMNGPLMKRATNPGNEDGLLHRVASSRMSLEEKVEHLFLASVARKPTRRELSAMGDLFQSQPDQTAALESVWWALLNSNEFILDH